MPDPTIATAQDTEWVDSLPDYGALLPPTSTSLASRFSIFSLFRTSDPRSKLDAVDALTLIPCPSPGQVISAVSDFDQYLTHVKKVHAEQDGNEREEARRAVGGALLKVVSAICLATVRPGQGEDGDRVARLMQPSLEALFGLARSISSTLDGYTVMLHREVLGAIFEPTVFTPHLALLFSQPREIIQRLRTATRASHLKALSSPASPTSGRSLAVQAESYETIAIDRMVWLESFARHVANLDGLPSYARSSKNAEKGKKREDPESKAARKRAEQAAAKEAQAKKDRVSRIVLEAKLLRAELAAAMTTANIEAVKRRAGVYDYLIAAAELVKDGVGEEGEVAGEGSRDKYEANAVSPSQRVKAKARTSLKRQRSFSIDSDDELMRSARVTSHSPKSSSNAKDRPAQEALGELARQTEIIADAPSVDTAYRWEDEAELALITALQHAADLVQAKQLEALVAKVERGNWLGDGGVSSSATRPSSASAQKTGSASTTLRRGTKKDIDDTSESDNSEGKDTDSEPEESDSEADDNTHSCPLRTLFRLHDQYQEQRLGIWDRLPIVNSAGAKRGSQREYMRGKEGRVGVAWERLGGVLLGMMKYDQLEAYGLEHDKYQEWLNASKDAKRPGQGRKRSRQHA